MNNTTTHVPMDRQDTPAAFKSWDTLSEGTQIERDRPAPGAHNARLLDVIYMGESEDDRYGTPKRKGYIRFRFALQGKEGFTASMKVSLSFHPLSKMLPVLKALATAPPESLDDLIGNYCTVEVEHKDKYHFVSNVMPATNGHAEFEMPANYPREKDRDFYNGEDPKKGPADIRNPRSNSHDASLARHYESIVNMKRREGALRAYNQRLAERHAAGATSGDRAAQAPQRTNTAQGAPVQQAAHVTDDLPF